MKANDRRKMNLAIPVSAVFLVLFCSGCENNKAAEAALRVRELDERQGELKAKVYATEVELLESEEEKSQEIRALEELAKKNRDFFEEVRTRLTAIESEASKFVKLDELGESWAAELEKAVDEYVEKDEMFERLRKEVFDDSKRIQAFEKEIEALKKDR